MNKPARGREVDEEVHEVNVFDGDPQLSNPASRNVSWDGVRADRHDVGDTPLRQSSRSPSSGQTMMKTEEAH